MGNINRQSVGGAGGQTEIGPNLHKSEKSAPKPWYRSKRIGLLSQTPQKGNKKK